MRKEDRWVKEGGKEGLEEGKEAVKKGGSEREVKGRRERIDKRYGGG